jgi:hypothetical protein
MMRLIGRGEKRKDRVLARRWIARHVAAERLIYVLIEASKGSVRLRICPARE